jgi:uncharacterized membrane protein
LRAAMEIRGPLNLAQSLAALNPFSSPPDSRFREVQFGTLHAHTIMLKQSIFKGTNGGVTIGGLVFSFIGGLIVGIAYYISVVQLVDTGSLLASPAQWPLIFAGGIAGLIGSVVDSLLGATLQFSGIFFILM